MHLRKQHPRTCASLTGSLRTPNNSDPDLTIVAVSHDQPGELPSVGETNLWSALGKKLGSPWQGVDVMIHIGGQVITEGVACLLTVVSVAWDTVLRRATALIDIRSRGEHRLSHATKSLHEHQLRPCRYRVLSALVFPSHAVPDTRFIQTLVDS